jgi:hypothetical protein
MLAIGAAVLAVVVALARNVEAVKASSVLWVVIALALSAAFGIAAAIVAGVVFTYSGTLTGLRVGESIALGLGALSYAAFAIAAYVRALEVPSVPLTSRVGDTSTQPGTYGTPPSQAPPQGQWSPDAPPTAWPNVPPQQPPQRFCIQCGVALAVEAQFCQRCGTPVR